MTVLKQHRLTSHSFMIEVYLIADVWHAALNTNPATGADIRLVIGHGASERKALADLVRQLSTLMKEVDGL